MLALSRQHFSVRFSDAEKEVGAIAVKAGQVIGAEDFRTRAEGADALKALIGNPGTSFSVVMLPPDSPGAKNAAVIGRLAELLPEEESGRPDVAQAQMAEPDSAGSRETRSDQDILDLAEPQAPDIDGTSVEIADVPHNGTERDPPPPAPPGDRPSGVDEVILHGNVSDASFEEILEVLQLSEQPLVVVFIRDGSRIGTLTLMSERVLAASAGSLQGMEAFERLYADHGETFEVRRATTGDPGAALGSVTELLAEVQQPSSPWTGAPPNAPQGARSMFMRGRLSDFPMGLLIGSLDLSRQPMELEFRRDEKILHRVRLKSGRIAAAESASGDGVEAALAAIREDPGDEFLVFRCSEPADGAPVASLAALLPETGGAADPIAGLQPAPDSPNRTAAPAATEEASEVLSQTAAVVANLLVDLEDTQKGAIQEIHTALAALGPRRGDRLLLRSILAVQLGCLAVTAGLLVLTVI